VKRSPKQVAAAVGEPLGDRVELGADAGRVLLDRVRPEAQPLGGEGGHEREQRAQEPVLPRRARPRCWTRGAGPVGSM